MYKATVSDQYRIQDLQIFYDSNQLLTQLKETFPFAPFTKLSNSHSAIKKGIEQGQINKLYKRKNLSNYTKAEKYSVNPQSTICAIT